MSVLGEYSTQMEILLLIVKIFDKALGSVSWSNCCVFLNYYLFFTQEISLIFLSIMIHTFTYYVTYK